MKIGVVPFTQHAAKQYPSEMMERVVKMLSEKYKVLLFGGGEKEKIVLEGWAETEPHPHPFPHREGCILCTVEKQPFAEELNLISTLDLMISMDSGNGYLAANFGVLVLTIWRLTYPFSGFAPYGRSKKNWLLPDIHKYPDIPTSVYGNNMPHGYETAMENITPEVVVEKVEELLN